MPLLVTESVHERKKEAVFLKIGQPWVGAFSTSYGDDDDDYNDHDDDDEEEEDEMFLHTGHSTA